MYIYIYSLNIGDLQMKKVRFFSVAVAVIAALFVSVWAGTLTHPIPTQNGYATGQTSQSCRTMTGPATSFMTKVTLKGTLALNSYCTPPLTPSGRTIRLLDINGKIIGEVSVPLGTMFKDVVINFPSKTYKANEALCIAAYVSTTTTGTLCGISLTGASATFEWTP